MGARRGQRGLCRSRSRPIWRCGRERLDSERWPLDLSYTQSFTTLGGEEREAGRGRGGRGLYRSLAFLSFIATEPFATCSQRGSFSHYHSPDYLPHSLIVSPSCQSERNHTPHHGPRMTPVGATATRSQPGSHPSLFPTLNQSRNPKLVAPPVS
jgi:hypothetical protein